MSKYFAQLTGDGEVMRKANNTWGRMNELKGVTKEEFFLLTFGFDYDPDGQYHSDHMFSLTTFLTKKIAASLAYRHFPEGFNKPCMYVKDEKIQHLNHMDKLFRIWNMSVGTSLYTGQIMDLVKLIFETEMTSAMVTKFCNAVSETTNGIKTPRGGGQAQNGYALISKIPLPTFDAIVNAERARNNEAKKAEYATKKKKKPVIPAVTPPEIANGLTVQMPSEVYTKLMLARTVQSQKIKTFRQERQTWIDQSQQIKELKQELAEAFDEIKDLTAELKTRTAPISVKIGDALDSFIDEAR
ncbi:MAG: hypothetical protein ACTSX1_09065 [Candidatus Heimdallarchaeaceae archaeon]